MQAVLLRLVRTPNNISTVPIIPDGVQNGIDTFGIGGRDGGIVVWINNPDRVGCFIQGVRKDIMPPKIMSTVLIEKPCLDPQDAGRIGIKC